MNSTYMVDAIKAQWLDEWQERQRRWAALVAGEAPDELAELADRLESSEESLKATIAEMEEERKARLAAAGIEEEFTPRNWEDLLYYYRRINGTKAQ